MERPNNIPPGLWNLMLKNEEMMAKHDWTPDDVLLCSPKGSESPFPDNREGPCSECGRTILYRPWGEVAKKICMMCAPSEIVAMALAGGQKQ